MQCEQVRKGISEYEESGMVRIGAVREHVESCAGCRAELETYEGLKAALGSLATKTVQAPAWLEGTLVETVTEKAAKLAARRKIEKQLVQPKVLTGGALVAAGVAGALLFRSRKRRRRGLGFRLRGAAAAHA